MKIFFCNHLGELTALISKDECYLFNEPSDQKQARFLAKLNSLIRNDPSCRKHPFSFYVKDHRKKKKK